MLDHPCRDVCPDRYTTLRVALAGLPRRAGGAARALGKAPAPQGRALWRPQRLNALGSRFQTSSMPCLDLSNENALTC